MGPLDYLFLGVLVVLILSCIWYCNDKYILWYETPDITHYNDIHKFSPNKKIRKYIKKLKRSKWIVVFKDKDMYYVVDMCKDYKKGNLVVLANREDKHVATRVMACNAWAGAPPIFRNNATLLDHSVIGPVTHIIDYNSSLGVQPLSQEQLAKVLDL